MPEANEAWLFYCAEYEPEMPSVYKEVTAFLRAKKVKTHVVDVYKNPLLANRFNVLVSPILIVKKDSRIERYVGYAKSLKKTIMENGIV